MTTIKIITDSTSDLPPDKLQEWGIMIIPLFVNYGGGSFADDGVELDREAFYRTLPDLNEFPTTAAPSPGFAEEWLAKGLEEADHVVGIFLPSTLSATFNNIRLGAANLDESRITLIDSHTVGPTIGLQAVIAAEVAKETGDVDRVVQAVKAARAHTKLYVVAQTLEYLKRSGRVSSVIAGLGSVLQIKPILQVENSEVVSAGRVRTFKKAYPKLRELVEEKAPLERVVIAHTNNPEGAEKLKGSLADLLPDNTFISEIGPVVGAHLGPGAIGVCVLSESWREGLEG